MLQSKSGHVRNVVLVLAVLVSVAQAAAAAVGNVPAVESKTSGMMDYAGELCGMVCDRLHGVNEVWVYRCGVFAGVGGLSLLIPIYMNESYMVHTDVDYIYTALLVLSGVIFAGVNGYFMRVQFSLLYVILYGVICVEKVQEIIKAILGILEGLLHGSIFDYGAFPLFLGYYAYRIGDALKNSLGKGLYLVPFLSAIGTSVWVWAIYGIWRLFYLIYTLTPLYKEEKIIKASSIDGPTEEIRENVPKQIGEKLPEKKPRVPKPATTKTKDKSGCESAMQGHPAVNLTVGLLAAALATLCM